MATVLEHTSHSIAGKQNTYLGIAQTLKQMGSTDQSDIVVPSYGPRLRVHALSLEGILEHCRYDSSVFRFTAKQLDSSSHSENYPVQSVHERSSCHSGTGCGEGSRRCCQRASDPPCDVLLPGVGSVLRGEDSEAPLGWVQLERQPHPWLPWIFSADPNMEDL